MLRSVAGSLMSTILVVGGLLLIGLWMLNLSARWSSRSWASRAMVGLAVGFAFRDITENFIASILLGIRRPFRIGDYIEVAGQAGVVRVAEHPGDRAGHARRETDPDSEQYHL